MLGGCRRKMLCANRFLPAIKNWILQCRNPRESRAFLSILLNAFVWSLVISHRTVWACCTNSEIVPWIFNHFLTSPVVFVPAQFAFVDITKIAFGTKLPAISLSLSCKPFLHTTNNNCSHYYLLIGFAGPRETNGYRVLLLLLHRLSNDYKISIEWPVVASRLILLSCRTDEMCRIDEQK